MRTTARPSEVWVLTTVATIGEGMEDLRAKLGMGLVLLMLLSGMAPVASSASGPPTTAELRWSKTSGFPVDGVFWGIAVEPGDPSKLYAAIEDLGFMFSEDGGKTWERRDPGHHHVRGVFLDPFDKNTLYYLYGEGVVVIDRQTGDHLTSSGLGMGFGWSFENSASAIAVDPSGTIYLTSPGGVFKSTDKGVTIERIGEGLPSETIYSALAIDPSNSNVIYVGTREKRKFDDPQSSDALEEHEAEGYLGHGVYKSVDGGRTWHSSSSGLSDLSVNAILVDPMDPRKLYAATYGGVFLSADSGASWTSVSSGLSSSEVWTLVADPNDPQRMYAGTWGGGVFFTQDGGSTWSKTGFNDIDFQTDHIFSLALDPNDTSTLYIGTGGGLFRYDTRDRSFSHVDGSRALRAVHTAVNPRNSSIVYTLEECGLDIYRSLDGGSSWDFIGPFVKGPTNWGWPPLGIGDGNFIFDGDVLGHTYGMQIAFDPLDDDVVYYSSDNGFYVSDNGGDNWRLLSDQDHAHGIAIYPKDPNVIYVSSHTHDRDPVAHMLKSEDGGGTWTRIDNGLPRIMYHQETVLVDPDNSDIVYMASTGRGIGCGSGCVAVGIYKTIDGGDSWFAASDGLDSRQVPTMAFDPADSNVLYAGAGDSLYVSRDAGSSWAKIFSVENAEVSSLAIDPRDPSLIVVGTFGEAGAYASFDGGGSWGPVNGGLADQVGTPNVWHLAVDPRGGTMYASTERGVFKATYGEAAPVSPDGTAPDVAVSEPDVIDPLLLVALGVSAGSVLALLVIRRQGGGRGRA